MFLSTTPNINTTKLFCELHSMLLLSPTVAILEISVASEQRRGKFCHSISIQSTYFVRQLSVENVKVFIFNSVMPLYSSGGPFNMVAVGFSFPKIDAQSSPISEISGHYAQNPHAHMYVTQLHYHSYGETFHTISGTYSNSDLSFTRTRRTNLVHNNRL